MLKKDLYIKAMKAGKYRKLSWIISAFSIVKNSNPDYKDYDIVSDLTGYSVYDPETKKYEKIQDAVVGQSLYNFKDSIVISSEDIPIINEITTTTYGRLLFNYLVIYNCFGNKLPYQNSKVSLSKIEELILSKLKDGDKLDDENIYIEDYLNYTKAVYFLTGLSQLCSQGVTEKTLLPPPGIKEYRDSLLEKYKDTLNEMSTIAKIDALLIEYDSKYLKGDDGENFLISKKSRGIVRKRLFLMHGAEQGLEDNNVNATLIKNSLSEGWDISKFSDMNNSLRAGSFNRGAQTELGGVAVKWLLRASSNINITVDDCGSLVGAPITVNENNSKSLVGFTIIGKNKSIPIEDLDQANTYLGKKVMLRNPMYCKLDFTDYCKICVGKRLTVNPTGLSIAVSNYGSVFLSQFMAAAHSKALEVQELDLYESIF